MAELHRLGRTAAILAFTAVLTAGCTNTMDLPLDIPLATTAATAAALTPEATAQTGAVQTIPSGAVTLANANFTDADAYTDWNGASYTAIALTDAGFTVNGQGAKADGNVLTISSAGTYVFSGSCADGAALVDTDGDVRIVLNNASLTCKDGAPIYIRNAKSAVLSLAPGTQNALIDGNTYTYALYSQEDGVPSAALYSKADLTLNGTGSLTVTGAFGDAVSCAGTLKILEAALTVQARDDGVVADTLIGVQSGALTVDAGGDGLKAAKQDGGSGSVVIANGTFHITSGGDGISAAAEVYIKDGEFELATAQAQAPDGAGQGGQATPGTKSGSGSANSGKSGTGAQQPPTGGKGSAPSGTPNGAPPSGGKATSGNKSAGSKSPATKKPSATPAATPAASQDSQTAASTSQKGVKAGTFLTIAGGKLTVDTVDDALHSSGSLAVTGGTLTLSSGDDGIHADATAAIGGGTVNVTGSYEGVEGCTVLILDGKLDITAQNDGLNAAGSDDGTGTNSSDTFAAQEPSLTIAGGDIKINAAGDGIDTNGTGAITGGTVFISGPEDSKNSALDYDKTFTVDGGFLVALGGAGKAQAPSGESKQYTIAGNLADAEQAGTTVTLKDKDGNIIASYTSPKAYRNVTFSSIVLEKGATYTMLVDNMAVQTVTVDETVTTFNLPLDPPAATTNG